MNVNWEFESELALKAVSKTAELLVNSSEVPKIDLKGDHKDIVTEADISCEAIILEILKATSHTIVGEESSTKTDVSKVLDNPAVWFVDPIDGTTNFASGMPLYGSSIGLYAKGEFVVGAVCVPPQRELFFTYGDHGSFMNGRRLSVKNRVLKSASIVASFSNSKVFKEQRQKEYSLFGKLNEASRTNLRLGSAAINICYVADGRLHGAYGFNACMWDIAGGLAIAKQAGCKIYLNLNVESLTASYVVGVPTVATELFSILKEEGFLHE